MVNDKMVNTKNKTNSKEIKFGHTSDPHMGSYENDIRLSNFEESAFVSMMDKFIEKNADFIIISGDFFDVSHPDLSIVDKVVKKLKDVRGKNINIYIVYGSHDYSPGGKSIVDILVSAGLVENLFKSKIVDGKLKLEFTVDSKTGVKLVGIPGRRMGLESEYYKILDMESLEKEEGVKIFVFHSGIDEIIRCSDNEHVTIKYLPKGFDYYAGGHVHNKSDPLIYEGYGMIIYPGMPFSAQKQDLKDNLIKGFYFVNISIDENEQLTILPEFIPIKVFKCESCDYNDINDLASVEELKRKISQYDTKDKAITLNIKGSEIISMPKKDIENMENILRSNGAISVNINICKDINMYEQPQVKGEIGEMENNDNISRETIEKEVFKKELEKLNLENSELKGDLGLNLIIDLLRCIGQDRQDKDGRDTYRVVYEGKKVLKLQNLA
jgi:exonuclease SbcD